MEQVAVNNQKRKKSLHQWVMDILGNEWCGSTGPPRQNRKIYIHDDRVYRVFSMQDDGGFVGIGYPNEWHVIIRWEAARMFAWWVLKIWILDWFGLRSHIWYVALHRSVKGKWKIRPYKHKKSVWKSSYKEWWEKEGYKEYPHLYEIIEKDL